MAGLITGKAPVFRSTDELIEYIPDNEKNIFLFLQKLVLSNLPHATEKLSYNVPFYYGKKRICFLWPGSVPWGKHPFQGVQMGFCYGSLIQILPPYFDLGTRKQVSLKTFTTLHEIDSGQIRSYLWEASEIDRNF